MALSIQVIFTGDPLKVYLLLQTYYLKYIPEKATLPATMQCLLIVIVFYHVHTQKIDLENFLNCLSFTVLIRFFEQNKGKERKNM